MNLIEANEDHKLQRQSDDQEFHSWEKFSLRNVEEKRLKKKKRSDLVGMTLENKTADDRKRGTSAKLCVILALVVCDQEGTLQISGRIVCFKHKLSKWPTSWVKVAFIRSEVGYTAPETKQPYFRTFLEIPKL
jgi:hypothetical protein